MNRKVGWLLAGVLVGIVAVGPWQSPIGSGNGQGDDPRSTIACWP